MGKMIFAWVLVNAVDAASTITLLKWGNREANPLMPLSPEGIIAFKAVGCLIALFVFSKFENPMIMKASTIGIGIFAAWNVSLMILLR